MKFTHTGKSMTSKKLYMNSENFDTSRDSNHCTFVRRFAPDRYVVNTLLTTNGIFNSKSTDSIRLDFQP
jgi:hypothetical protein